MNRSPKTLSAVWIASFFVYYVVIPCLLLGATWLIRLAVSEPPINFGWINWAVGLVILAPNLAISVWTLVTLHKEGQGTPFPIAATQKLVTTGPYAHSRNPLVVSTFSVYWGVGVIIGSPVFIILTSFFFLVMVVAIALFEEKSLERRFGREYLLYRQKTPFMIPRKNRRIKNELL